VIGEHLETFLHAAAEAGGGVGLPQFVEREFREFLLCGVFEAGVARFQCEGCGREHLVPFSCKGRGWCPSCGGRRMTERAAHLVDAVLPWVPVRQWVLTVPYRLRYQLAWNHGLHPFAALGARRRRPFQFPIRSTHQRRIAHGWNSCVAICSAPAVAQDRLRLLDDGRIVLTLKTAWADSPPARIRAAGTGRECPRSFRGFTS